MDVKLLIQQREKTHGSFDDNSRISEAILKTLESSPNFEGIPPTHKNAVRMIVCKISRACSGNSNHEDVWLDIAGYATLVADRCQPDHPELPLVSSSILTPPPGWRRMEGHERVDTVSRLFGVRGWVAPASVLLGKKEADVAGAYITPVWHNPRKLESPGEGYRFLLTSETRQDATHYWDFINDIWGPITAAGEHYMRLSPEYTYRTNKPLPCPPHNTTS